jgi:hypothetical protein
MLQRPLHQLAHLQRRHSFDAASLASSHGKASSRTTWKLPTITALAPRCMRLNAFAKDPSAMT